MAFFEPLHEQLGELTYKEIVRWTSETTNLGHPHLDAPYFAEYTDALNPIGVGVEGHRPEFGLHSYFDDSDEGNEGLAEYLQGLIDLALSRNKIPVFKFTRMLARAGWLRRTFPDAKQVLLLRDPLQQFWSSLCLAREGNSLLLAAPMFALSHASPDTLGIPHIEFDHGVTEVLKFYADFVDRSEPDVLFKLYMIFHNLSLLKSAQFADKVIHAPADRDRPIPHSW